MGVRRGQGYNVPKPKRAHCPECDKKGVKQWYSHHGALWRDCQYCMHTWGEISWSTAMAEMKREPAPLSEPPNEGEDYWRRTESGKWLYTWVGDSEDLKAFKSGNAFKATA